MPKKPSHPPEAYQQRDAAILRHVAAYRLALIESVSQVIGIGANLGHIVRRLADDGLLELFSRKLPGGVSYAQLTERGAQRIGVPRHRAIPLGNAALDPALAVLTWSCLSSSRRYRIEAEEAAELLPGLEVSKNHAYCVSEEDGRATLSRVIPVHGGNREVVQTLEQNVAKVTGEVERALHAKQFQFVFLTDTEQKAKSLAAAIERSRVLAADSVRVATAATSPTIATYLREFKKGHVQK
jgi:hypothetical protein